MFPFCNPYLPSFSHPENPENQCDSILATSLEMQPHPSQSSREENATPSRGTSSLGLILGRLPQ